MIVINTLKKLSFIIFLSIAFSSVSVASNFTEQEKKKIQIALKYFPSEIIKKDINQLSETEQSQLKLLLANVPDDETQLKGIYSFFPTSKINALGVKEKEVIVYLQSKLFVTLMRYINSVSGCYKKAEKKKLPSFNEKKIKSLGLEPMELNVIFMHLNIKNTDLCSKDSRLELVWALGLLESTFQEYTQSPLPKKLKEAISLFVYPTPNSLELELKYHRYPSKTREYFSNTIGNEVFDNHIIESWDELDLIK